MQQGFNQILLLGNLTEDPGLRRTGNGAAVCVFRFAVDDVRRPAPGADPVKETLYVDVMTVGHLAETCHAALSQGSRAFVQGRLQLREWVGRDGLKHSSHRVFATHVTFLDPRPGPADAPAFPPPAPDAPPSGDLPF